MIGMAEGATAAGYPTHYMDILVINVGPWIEYAKSPTAKYPSPVSDLPPKKFEYDPPEGYVPGPPTAPVKTAALSVDKQMEFACSRWAAWDSATKDGKLICGDSFDGGLQWQFNYVAFPHKGYPFVCSSTYFGELYRHPGMNTKGLWVSGGYLPTPRDIDKGYGLTVVLGMRHLLQFYGDADKAKDVIIKKWKFTGGRVHNWIVAGANSEGKTTGYIFELTNALNTYRKAGDFGEKDWIAAANTFVKPENCKLMAPDFNPFETDPRIVMEWTYLNQYHGKIDIPFAKMLYRVVDPIKNTLYIGHLNNTSVHLGKPAEGIYLSCYGPATRKTLAHPGWGWGNVDSWNSFYTVTLKNDPLSVVKAAKKSAENACKRANEAMAKLTLSPDNLASYLAEKKIFFDATNEIYRGHNFLTDSRLANGNDSLYFFSKALTKYARAETLYNAVANLIDPPPETPDQLGLEPMKEYPRPPMRSHPWFP